MKFAISLITVYFCVVGCKSKKIEANHASAPQERIEHQEHIEYHNYPLNSVLSDCAKMAGYVYFVNTELDDNIKYLVTGTISKSTNGAESFDELAFMYGCTGFLKGDTMYCLTEEQLAKLPRREFMWKVRYIRPEDIAEVIDKLRQCLTVVDSKVEYLSERNIIQIQGRSHEVEKAELLLDQLDSEEVSHKQ